MSGLLEICLSVFWSSFTDEQELWATFHLLSGWFLVLYGFGPSPSLSLLPVLFWRLGLFSQFLLPSFVLFLPLLVSDRVHLFLIMLPSFWLFALHLIWRNPKFPSDLQIDCPLKSKAPSTPASQFKKRVKTAVSVIQLLKFSFLSHWMSHTTHFLSLAVNN